MSETVVKVEGLGKKFFLGHQRSGQLRETLGRKLCHILKYGRIDKEEFWALRDLSFEIKRGDVVGIIGRNGAGKSTLLKILSRITEPTTVRFEINGRVSSLLEVGTGFHSELTGRENIFLNGTILGMRRSEIKRKFDEIVAFSGVEKFLDTPVKHYSSGMRVRLAFSVAAHLEPEILIIDEVLAVGDTEFQKKCLGKMDEVSRKEGRTILFVSHNLAAVESLCTSGILMDSARIKSYGRVPAIIRDYLDGSLYNRDSVEGNWDLPNKIIKRVELISDGVRTGKVVSGRPFEIMIHFENNYIHDGLVVGIAISTEEGQTICAINNRNTGHRLQSAQTNGRINIKVPTMTLFQDREYWLDIFWGDRSEDIETVKNVIRFSVVPRDIYRTGQMLKENRNLFFLPGIEFRVV